MKLENVKHLIDDYFEGKSKEELEEIFKKYVPSNKVESKNKEFRLFAAMAMQGLLANTELRHWDESKVAQKSISYAHTLIYNLD